MKGRALLLIAGLLLVTARGSFALAAGFPAQQETGNSIPEDGEEHLRMETDHGPIHLWRPARYDPRTAGMVVYIHGYFAPVDQTWTDDSLAAQFGASGRNALFIAIEAPQANYEDVYWKSLADLLRTVAESVSFPLPRGPVVVVGHSGAYRTILMWLGDPRVQYVILLDGLYSGQSEFRSWLRPQSLANPHRMVLVAIDTRWQSNRFARRVTGTVRRGYIPARASNFTSRETHARLLYLRSQYDHGAIVSSGKVIPVLLAISPLKALPAVKPPPAGTLADAPLTIDK